MGCGCGKATAGQVHVASLKKEPLPAALAAAAKGRFQSALSPISEGKRDFARIFFANERKIFLIAPNMPSMRPLQPTSSASSAHIGDMSEQVVNRAEALFRESLSQHLDQALPTKPDPSLFETLISRAVAAMTVNVGVDFALQMRLVPTFLQPVFLIIVLGDMSQARAATYGFVAERPQQIVGDRPESKRTPFCIRLLSPSLLEEGDPEDFTKWEVEYSAMEVHTSTCTQAVEMDMPKVREAISTKTWGPLVH